MSARLARRAVLVLAAALTGVPALAEDLVTEVLPAGYRDAGELAAVLKPLVPPPGSVNGFAGQLVVKTTPANMAEIKQVLVSLDRAPANLLVSVRRTTSAQVQRDLAEARARVSAGGVQARAGSRTGGSGATVQVERGDVAAGVRVQRQHRTQEGDEVQSLRVLEGKQAFISNGESVPVGERSAIITGAGVSVVEGVRYEEFGSGFFVRPRLNGDVVILDIIPSSRQRRGDGSAAVQEASTSVTGRLGQWMEIGGVNTASSRSSSGLTSSRTITTRRDDGIYVMVERLD